MSKATLRFELRTDRTTNGKHPIVIRLYANRKNKYISTIFKAAKREWSFDQERTKSDGQINNYLNDISSKFNQFIINYPNNCNLDQIASSILEDMDEKKMHLLQFIRLLIEDKEKKNEVIRKTILRYTRVEQVMTDFLTERKLKNILVSDINLEFINSYDTFVKSNLKVNHRPIETNTINKYHSIFRTILIQAVNEEKLKVNPYNLFKLKSKPVMRNFLSDYELQLFRNNSFDIDRIEKVRLIYLFSCYTGIRFEDAQKLSQSNLKKTIEGGTYLSFVSSKSDKQQEIPLLNEAVFIINEIKEKFKPELAETNKLLPKISNQKFNDYLKSLSIRIGLNKELTHHTARHTFATYMLSKGVAPTALQVLLGHSNLKETMIYAKITPEYLLKEVNKGNARI